MFLYILYKPVSIYALILIIIPEEILLKENIIRGVQGEEYKFDSFIKEVVELNRNGYGIFIGSDSQIIKDKVSMVTCVCAYKNGGGGSRIFYVKNRLPKKKFPTTRLRLLYEAYKSIETAMELDEFIDDNLTIHLDIGSDMIRSYSSRYKKELQTLVTSQGYGCEIKPDSWASSVADRFTKS